MLPINMQRGGKASRYKNPEYDHRRTHYQDLPCTLNWGYMVPNDGYLSPNRG